MFLRIIKNEWRILFAERSFLILAVVFSILIGYGIYNGASWIKERENQSRQLLEPQEKDLAERKEKVRLNDQNASELKSDEPNPGDPYDIGMDLHYTVLPFASSAVLSLGQSDVLTPAAGVSATTLQRTKAEKTGFENPLGFLSGRFDLSFVIVYLLPLFILALSFNALSNEREQGILQLLLSQSIKLKTLLTAKITAQFILIFAIILAVGITGVLLSAASFNFDFWERILLWILLIAAYSVFWFALAALINSFGFSSPTNAVVAATAWLMLVLILPSLLNVAIAAVYPVPPRSELISAMRSVNLDMRRDGSKMLAEHYQDHPELMPKSGQTDLNDFGLAFAYIQGEQKKRIGEVEDRFSTQIAKQQNLVRNLRFLSPSIIAQEASNDIAGTGLERYQHFRAQVKDFDQKWTNFFVPYIYRMEMLNSADFDRMPEFQYEEEPFGEVFSRVIWGILFMLGVSAILLTAAFDKLTNYQLQK